MAFGGANNMGRHEPSAFGVTVCAAMIGFAAGILFAPKSGVETRKDVKRRAKQLEGHARRGLEVAKETANEGKKEFKAVAGEVAHDAKELSDEAKVRAKRTLEHSKTGAQNVENRARQAWGDRTRP